MLSEVMRQLSVAPYSEIPTSENLRKAFYAADKNFLGSPSRLLELILIHAHQLDEEQDSTKDTLA